MTLCWKWSSDCLQKGCSMACLLPVYILLMPKCPLGSSTGYSALYCKYLDCLLPTLHPSWQRIASWLSAAKCYSLYVPRWALFAVRISLGAHSSLYVPRWALFTVCISLDGPYIPRCTLFTVCPQVGTVCCTYIPRCTLFTVMFPGGM